MQVAGKSRICTTELLREIAREADTRQYNRQLHEDALTQLDGRGWHVLKPMMLHSQAGGVTVEPHMRVLAYIKLENQEQPVQVFLDVPMDLWNATLDPDDVREMVGGA